MEISNRSVQRYELRIIKFRNLDIETVMEPEKTVRNVNARSVPFDLPLQGYEIHLGRTDGPDHLRPYVAIQKNFDGLLLFAGKLADL